MGLLQKILDGFYGPYPRTPQKSCSHHGETKGQLSAKDLALVLRLSWCCLVLFYGNQTMEMVYGKTKQQPKYHLKISSSARLVALAAQQLQTVARQLVHPPGMCLWLLFAISGGKEEYFLCIYII